MTNANNLHNIDTYATPFYLLDYVSRRSENWDLKKTKKQRDFKIQW